MQQTCKFLSKSVPDVGFEKSEQRVSFHLKSQESVSSWKSKDTRRSDLAKISCEHKTECHPRTEQGTEQPASSRSLGASTKIQSPKAKGVYAVCL
jgi:hypothetical protein